MRRNIKNFIFKYRNLQIKKIMLNLSQKNYKRRISNLVIFYLSSLKDDLTQFNFYITKYAILNINYLQIFSKFINSFKVIQKIEKTIMESLYASQQPFQKQSNPQSSQNSSSPMIKISNFLEMKNISIHDFWLSNRNYASPQDIVSFCSSCGLKIGIHDQINMKAQLFNVRQIISIYEFCQSIPFWKQKGKQMVSDFLKKRSELLIEQLQSKQKKRPKSSNFTRTKTNTQFNGYESKYSRQSSLSKLKKQPQNLNYNQNYSRKYLQKFKQKQELMEKQLAQTIDKTKNQYEYGMLLKMSEMNQKNRQKNSNETYRAYKSAEGIIRVRVFQLNKFVREINLKQFDRIYKSFKKNTKQKKQWAITNQSEQKQNKTVHSLKMKNARKADRQQQLKNLLVNTVNLTNLLKQQIKIFKKKGIYGCEQL